MKKGQTIEILGFLALVVVVIISTLGLKLVTVDQKSDAMQLAQESQEIESFNSGVKTMMVITEPTTSKTFVELMGMVGFFEKDTLNFGPTNNPIVLNVSKELTKNLDLIYGKGNWQLEIPNTPRYQIYVVIIIDISPSMKDEIYDIKEHIVDIMADVEKSTNRRVFYKLYSLYSNLYYQSDFNDIEQNYPNFKTEVMNFCSIGGSKNEAWARGMKCVIDNKADEWGDVATAKVGIILSDEPPSGCEGCGCQQYDNDDTENCCPNEPGLSAHCRNVDAGVCSTKEGYLDSLVTAASQPDINMKIYTMQANPCQLPSGTPGCTMGPVPYTCAGKDKLEEFMTDLSTRTNAATFKINTANPVSEALKEIVLTADIPEESLIIGTTPPAGERIRSQVIPAPTPIPGHYVNVVLKQWS